MPLLKRAIRAVAADTDLWSDTTWVVDSTPVECGRSRPTVKRSGWLKCGAAPPGVARQYTGTAGKVMNCQIGVSLNLVTDVASCPVDWRLFLPESWDPASPAATADVDQRRARAQIPDDVGHREKWRLGLDMIDEVIGWGYSRR